jgi:hypothetical protein
LLIASPRRLFHQIGCRRDSFTFPPIHTVADES